MTLQEWKDRIKNGNGFSLDEMAELDSVNELVNGELTTKLKDAGKNGIASEFNRFVNNIFVVVKEPDLLNEEQFEQVMQGANQLDEYFEYQNNFADLMNAFGDNGTKFINLIGHLNKKLEINVDKAKWDNKYKEIKGKEAEQNAPENNVPENNVPENNAQPQNQPKYAWDDDHYYMDYLATNAFHPAKTALQPKKNGMDRGYYKTTAVDDDGYPLNIASIEEQSEQEHLQEIMDSDPEMRQRYNKNKSDLRALEKDIRDNPFKGPGVDTRLYDKDQLTNLIDADETKVNNQLDEEVVNYAKQYAYRNTELGTFISPASQHVHTSINSFIRSDVGVQKVKRQSEDFSNALIKEAKKQDDKTYKQFLENKAFKVDFI